MPTVDVGKPEAPDAGGRYGLLTPLLTFRPYRSCYAGNTRSFTAQWFDSVVEARAHRVLCLLAGIWLLNGFDLAFTLIAHGQGVLHEENPLARLLLDRGTTAIILFKTGLVLVGSYPFLRFRLTRVTELAAYLVFAAYAALAFRWAMCVELYSAAAFADLTLADVQHLLENPRR